MTDLQPDPSLSQREDFPRKFGNYHLLSPLAQGGMGALYLAVSGQADLRRFVVIKTVLPHLADAEYIARFHDEAKVVVQLSHANLIPVFDAGTVDGEIFLAMDFVDGSDLRAVWNRCAKKQVAFPIDIAVYMAKELSRGLGYAHAYGDIQLVHRDVSPPNILMSYSGEIKLTDFGLASSTLKLEKTAPGIIYGKVSYMSPEQARGDALDGRSDQYSLGIILWELLTGRQLFANNGDQPSELVSRARNPVVPKPSERAPRVPKELDAICAKALAPEREDRFSSCEELRQALSEWLAAEAPRTDAVRVQTFAARLFDEDMEEQKEQRKKMVASIRKKLVTLPPSDALRQLVEQTGGIDMLTKDMFDKGHVRQKDSVGRRETDLIKDASGDRRAQRDRRSPSQDTHLGIGSAQDRQDNRRGKGAVSAGSTSDKETIVGSVLNGRYRIDQLIGEGGMGKVYRGEHTQIGRTVAIKILHPVYKAMPDLVERFRREARAATRIGNVHIVDVTDSGTTKDGNAYFVMEYLEGKELGEVLTKQEPLDEVSAMHIAIQVCRALGAAHDVGIIHRDLKPENIFLTKRDGQDSFVKILDFGIAKSTQAEDARARKLTSPGMAMGTPEYMAPEQAAGMPATERCDIYAVGAILYEMLTGKPPYEGNNFMEILSKKASVEATPIRERNKEITEEVSELVAVVMARDPQQRPATMAELEQLLQGLLHGLGVAMAPMGSISTDPGYATHVPLDSLSKSSANNDTWSDSSSGSVVNTPRSSKVFLFWVVLGLLCTAIGVGVFALVNGESSVDEQQGTLQAVSGGGSSQPQPAIATLDGNVAANEPWVIQGTVQDTVPDKSEKIGATDTANPPVNSDTDQDIAVDARDKEQTAKKLFTKANRYLKQRSRGGYRKAQAAFLEVAKTGYVRGDAYMGASRAAFELKQWDKAIRYAHKARKYGHSKKAVLTQLGSASLRAGRKPEAKSYLRQLVNDYPKDKVGQKLLKAADSSQ